jgi:hypothetical protein
VDGLVQNKPSGRLANTCFVNNDGVGGRLPYVDPRRAIVTWAVGTPERPASGTVRGILKIIDRDHFRTDDSPTGEAPQAS